ncbi:response regulator [Zavarzinia sp. CC-PAN008]|uniref:response regulator n=1 Tax=Zavarzinia sp. CC-PAN008 TaxID=3243332 RepID=UPI003F74A380
MTSSPKTGEAPRPPGARGWLSARRPTFWPTVAINIAGVLILFVEAAKGEVLLAGVMAGALALANAVAVMVNARIGPAEGHGFSGPMLRAVLGESDEPRLVTDREGRVLHANPAWRTLLGPSFEHEPTLRDLPGLDPLAVEALDRLAAGALGTAGVTLRLSRPLQGSRHVAITAVPLAGPDGLVLWTVAPRLARPQGVARAFDHAGLGWFEANADGAIDLANHTLAGWLGLQVEAFNTARIQLDEILSLEDGGGPRRIGRLRTERQSAFPVEVVELPAEAAWRSAGVVRDLRSEAALRDAFAVAQARFDRFFNDAPIAIAVIDGEGAVIEANAAFSALATGRRDVTAVLDKPIVQFLLAEDRGVAKALQPGAVPPVNATEVRFRGPPERVAQLYSSPHQAPIGGAILFLLDTTEQKNLELQFAQSQKMQAVGQLAGGIAHDFNNLLTAIIGFSDLLLTRFSAGDPAFADLMQIKQNANRAANLVRQLLAFSRQQTLRPKVIDVTDVLAELSNLLRRLIGENIQLNMIHGRDLGLVKVDPGQLDQVIINLAVNARDAMTTGGVLTIRTSNVPAAKVAELGNSLMPQTDFVLIEVSDTGMGIPKENLGKIFEPFFTTKEVGAGTGLGLSTVYGIVKQTGGFIFPFSEDGRGATFQIYLPRHLAVEEPAAAAEADSPNARDLTGKGTILLVEDEDAVRVFAARALRNKGYTVLEANSGEAALEIVTDKSEQIDLLISDVVMPNMDGPTLIKHAKRHRPNMRIVFISGYAEEAFRRNLDKDEAFSFLPKPFSLKQLAAKVKEAIGV